MKYTSLALKDTFEKHEKGPPKALTGVNQEKQSNSLLSLFERGLKKYCPLKPLITSQVKDNAYPKPLMNLMRRNT